MYQICSFSKDLPDWLLASLLAAFMHQNPKFVHVAATSVSVVCWNGQRKLGDQVLGSQFRAPFVDLPETADVRFARRPGERAEFRFVFNDFIKQLGLERLAETLRNFTR